MVGRSIGSTKWRKKLFHRFHRRCPIAKRRSALKTGCGQFGNKTVRHWSKETQRRPRRAAAELELTDLVVHEVGVNGTFGLSVGIWPRPTAYVNKTQLVGSDSAVAGHEKPVELEPV